MTIREIAALPAGAPVRLGRNPGVVEKNTGAEIVFRDERTGNRMGCDVLADLLAPQLDEFLESIRDGLERIVSPA
jgi:hypothetical protein